MAMIKDFRMEDIMDAVIEIFNSNRFWLMPIMLAGVIVVLGWQMRMLFMETARSGELDKDSPRSSAPDMGEASGPRHKIIAAEKNIPSESWTFHKDQKQLQSSASG